MKHLLLFESWHEDSSFPVYTKQLNLVNLGLAPTPFKGVGSAAFAEFFEALKARLADMNMTVEIDSPDDTSEWATLEVEARNMLDKPVYLRFMLMPNSQNPDEVYVITANYVKEMSIQEPAKILDKIVELVNQILVPTLNDPDYAARMV